MDKNQFEREWNSILADIGEEADGEFGIVVYDMYKKLRTGGFTETQALRIISYGIFHQPQDGDTDGE